MEFLGLVLLNIFMGAILYLVISLKLEKSASEFKERKLRKEMDAIINEFNSTAERNITLLENKIKIMRKLLERAGDIKSVDLIVAEEMRHNQEKEALDEPPASKNAVDGFETQSNSVLSAQRKKGLNFFKSGLINIITGAGKFFSIKKAVIDYDDNCCGVQMDDDPAEAAEYKIEKDLSSITSVGRQPACRPDKQEIEAILCDVEDKNSLYNAISELHSRGCDIEELSDYSGLPAGEIKLVLNLHGARYL